MSIDLKEWEKIINKQEEIGGCPKKAKISFTGNKDCYPFTDSITGEEGIIFYVENEKLEVPSSIVVLDNGEAVVTTDSKITHGNIPDDFETSEESIVDFLDNLYIKATEEYYNWLQLQLIGNQDKNKLPGIIAELSEGIKVGSFTLNDKNVLLYREKVNIHLPVGYLIIIEYSRDEGKHFLDTKLQDSEGTIINRIIKTDITYDGLGHLINTLGSIVEPISL
ncbi:hypothetical protein pSco10_10 [Staphylococcus phage phiSA039]|nr:hypothetical protein pSco10_10 [Staphylococcus phage phiSA039]